MIPPSLNPDWPSLLPFEILTYDWLLEAGLIMDANPSPLLPLLYPPAPFSQLLEYRNATHLWFLCYD